jgi:hypothetical protein
VIEEDSKLTEKQQKDKTKQQMINQRLDQLIEVMD